MKNHTLLSLYAFAVTTLLILTVSKPVVSHFLAMAYNAAPGAPAADSATGQPSDGSGTGGGSPNPATVAPAPTCPPAPACPPCPPCAQSSSSTATVASSSSTLPTGPCDDGNPCTTGDMYVNGVCTPGAPRNCDDRNICTVDTCNSQNGTCVNKPAEGMACDDGNLNTVNDQCVAGTCTGTPVSSSSSSAPTFKGACIVRDSSTSLPSYADPDIGAGYAKVGKGPNFTSLDEIKNACTQRDYDAIGQTLCTSRPGRSYQMEVVLYEQNNTFKTNSCGSLGCNPVTCPAASSSSSPSSSPSSSVAPVSSSSSSAASSQASSLRPAATSSSSVSSFVTAMTNVLPFQGRPSMGLDLATGRDQGPSNKVNFVFSMTTITQPRPNCYTTGGWFRRTVCNTIYVPVQVRALNMAVLSSLTTVVTIQKNYDSVTAQDCIGTIATAGRTLQSFTNIGSSVFCAKTQDANGRDVYAKIGKFTSIDNPVSASLSYTIWKQP